MSASLSRGFTLVEFMLALVLGMLVVAVGLSVGYQHAQDVKAKEAGQSVLQVRDLADSAFSMNIGYITSDGILANLPDLYTLDNRLPLGVVNGNADPIAKPAATDLKNEWGGQFSVGVESSTTTATPACQPGPAGPAHDLLTITLDQVPSSVCVGMITQVAPQMYDTYVNNKLVALTPAPGNGVPGRRAVDISKAGPLCSAGPTATLKFRSLKPLMPSSLRGNPLTTTMTATEAACVQPQYTRVENAMAAREAAQAAL